VFSQCSVASGPGVDLVFRAGAEMTNTGDRRCAQRIGILLRGPSEREPMQPGRGWRRAQIMMPSRTVAAATPG